MRSEIELLDHHFDNLDANPISEIGMADRERFHVGMLAFTLNFLKTYNSSGFERLAKFVWGSDLKLGNYAIDDLIVETEIRSVDLQIRHGKAVIAFLEAKWKSTLSSGQLRKYKRAHPAAVATVVSLFPNPGELDDARHIQFGESLSVEINSAMSFDTREAQSEIVKLRRVYIQTWLEYLSDIGAIVRDYVSLELQAVANRPRFESRLKGLKLYGIFAQHRLSLVKDQLIASGLQTLDTELFNSRGNAGLDLVVDDIPNWRVGFQWQSETLKLFVERDDKKGAANDAERDKLLREIVGAFYCEYSIRKTIKLNRDGRFRSVSIRQDWNAFDNTTTRPDELRRYIRSLKEIAAKL